MSGFSDEKKEMPPTTDGAGVVSGPGATLPSRLEDLAETARDYARASAAANTTRAYDADWRDYLAWRSREGLEGRGLADAEVVGLYLAAPAAGDRRTGGRGRSVATIERRLSGLCRQFRLQSLPFDRKDRHVGMVLAGIKRTHGRPPTQKEALLPGDIVAMLDALPPSDLKGLRDRAILLIGFAGGLRRSEIVGLDCGPEDSDEAAGWPEFFTDGVLLTLRGKTGWREVEIGRGSSERTCPVAALRSWMEFARIRRGRCSAAL